MSQVCPDCGESYARLGSHWIGDCSPPSLTEHQLDISRGLLMGDGWLVRSGNSSIRAKMINQEYLEYIDEQFGVLGTGVSVANKPDNPNWNTTYLWGARAHSDFNQFDSWYTDDGKVWPADIYLSPTVLKHWYVGDGHFEKRGNSYRIILSLANERGNKQKLKEMFKSVGLSFSVWNENEASVNIQMTTQQSEECIDYMGEPLPGFENKWPEV